MAQVPGANRNSSSFAENRQATGNDAVSRLVNFFNANIGNTDKLANQLGNVITGQEQKAEQAIQGFNTNPSHFNEAAKGVQGLASVSNLLQSKGGLQGLVGSATNALNPQTAKIDTELLLRDPTALQGLKQRPGESFNQMFGKLNMGLDKAGYQALNKDAFKMGQISPMSKYYEQPSMQDEYEYEDVYEGEDGGTQSGSILDNALFKAYTMGNKGLDKFKSLTKQPEKIFSVPEKLITSMPVGGNTSSWYNDSVKKYTDSLKNSGIPGLDQNKMVENFSKTLMTTNPQLLESLPAAEVISKGLTPVVKTVAPIAAPISKAVSNVASSVGSVFKKLCFAPYTIVKMLDGSTKYIDDITIGDMVFEGGFVYAINRHAYDQNDLYDYKGIVVTGSHAVKENGEWKRIENTELAKKIDYPVDYVVSLSNTNHLILSGDVVFADFDEIDNSEYLSLDECLNKLNGK